MKRVVTIQDISCLGQCSLTVALPILSAMHIETSIVPTAVLSTHTAFFKGFTCHDLTSELKPIKEHWLKEGFKFNGIYSGYLASSEQIDLVKEYVNDFKNDDDFIYLCDPAMADFGKMYPAFDESFADKMAELCGIADYIIPNITEACFLTHSEYKEQYDKEYIEELLKKLYNLGCKHVIITGVSFKEGELGAAIYDGSSVDYCFNKRVNLVFHGTGDIFSSVCFGGLINHLSLYDSVKLAVDFTLASIEATKDIAKEHWYGVCFENVLNILTDYDYNKKSKC